MPEISVIIPVYNAEKYLDQTLESVRRQTMRDFEVIMVDDGSTDSSPSIMRRMEKADSRFRLVSRPNGGLSAARNTGIANARGEWLYFIDADDTLHPAALAYLLKTAQAIDVPVCIGGYFEDTEEHWPVDNKGEFTRIMSAGEVLRMALYQQSRINSACGVLIRGDMMRGEDGVRFTEGLYYEDLDLFPRLCLGAGRVAYTPRVLYFYRQHSGSILHTFAPRRLDSLIVTDRIYRLMEEQCPSALDAAADRRFSAAYNVLLLLEKYRPQGRPEERHRIYGESYEDVRRHCLRIIREGRRSALRDREVRLKNKLGALASYLGSGALRLLATRSR